MTRIVPMLALLVACGREAPAPAPSPTASGSAPEPPAPSAVFVGCAPAAPMPGAIEPVPRGWYPYAAGPVAADDVARPAIGDARAQILERLAEIDICFASARGSLVAMLRFGSDGKLASARVGGIGNAAMEDCVATQLKTLSIAAPGQAVELECGFSGEGGGPLRITLGADHDTIEVTASELRHAGTAYKSDAKPPMLDATRTLVVVAEPDAPAALVARALAWSNRPTLLAVKADGGAPVLVAVAADRTRGKHHVELRVDDGKLAACANGKRVASTASLVQARDIDELVKQAAAACGADCDETIDIAVDGKLVAKDLIAAASAARRAGHDPVLARTASCR